MDRVFLYENLLEWIRLFSFVPDNTSISSLLDGEVISEILYKIEPTIFTEEWKSKLSFDQDSNWKLKASNLKKILNTMTDFLVRTLNISLDNYKFPDVTKICESSDTDEMSRLLQLLLLCAVNCRQKEMYIQNIMSMKKSAQLVIMQAIQELIHNENSTENAFDAEDKVDGPSAEISSLKREKDLLNQKCHDLESKISFLNEEKHSLEDELKRLRRQSYNEIKIPKPLNDSSFDSENNSPESMRIRKLQERISTLQTELYKTEQSRDELNQKLEITEIEILEYQEKNSNLTEQISEQRHVKDELDIARERIKSLAGIESTLEKYKKHVDESKDLARNNKELEIENSNYLDRIMKLEEEGRNSLSLKNQIEMYNNEITEIQSICSQKEKEFMKADFELKRAQEKIKSLELDKLNLQDELKNLKSENDDLALRSHPNGSECSSDPNSEIHDTMNPSEESFDILEIPVNLRERVVRLQKEVQQLRRKALMDACGAENSTDINSQSREQLIVSVESAQARLRQLTSENKELHQDNLGLNAKIEDLSVSSNLDESKYLEAQKTIEKLTITIDQTEMKYKGYLEKAKYVIYHLHQKLLQHEQNTAANLNGSQEIDTPPTPTGEQDASFALVDKDSITRSDYDSLKTSFIEKERQLDELQKRYEREQCLREEEEKMVVAAWYNLGVRLNREAAQDRLRSDSTDAATISLKSTEPNSFLAKQRMAHLMSSSRSTRDDSVDRR